jgi:hypothetical protein
MKPSFFKNIAITLMLAIAPLSISTAQAVVKVGSYVGTWKPGITYVAGDLITNSNKTFLSLVKNKNKNPNSNPKVWQVLGGVAADGVGVIGPQGLPGIKGGTGSQGPQGYQGLTGLNGQQGIKGDKGDTGDIGPQGPIGLTGSQGIQGLTGPVGADSTVAGPQGIQGLEGLPQAGNNVGDMQYWDGTQWQIVPAPSPLPVAPAKAMLSFCMGTPSWNKDCAPPNTTVFQIGDKGPAGGIVFYLSDNSGIHGLEAAPVDQTPPIWGCIGYSISGAQATAVGAGPTNTSAIVNAGCSDSNTAAATIADTYSLNGYTDWYLPSKDELYLLYTFRENNPAVGGLLTGLYWSSSEVDAGNAFAVSLGNGSQYSTGKDINAQFRPIRSF